MANQEYSAGDSGLQDDPEWSRVQALIAQADVSRAQELEIAQFVLNRWPVSRTQWNSWTKSRLVAVTGPMLAQAASESGSIRSAELLELATEHATPAECLQIVLRASPGLSEASRHVLERHPRAVLTLLIGRKFSLSERVLGTPGEILFGYRGLIGPPGIVGLLVALATYVFIYPIGLGYFVLICSVIYFISRSLILRDVPPAMLPADLKDHDPTMVHTVANWVVRECALRGIDSGDWAQVSAPILEESVADTLDGLEENGDQASILGLFYLREFGSPELRRRAWESIFRLSDLWSYTPEDRIERAFSGLDVASPELVKSWFFRCLGVERRWGLSEFEDLFLSQCFFPYTQRVVWGGFNGYRELKYTFRIDEEGRRVDSDDRAVVFEPHTVIGLLNAATLESHPEWAQVFADYEIVSFMHQLEAVSWESYVTRARLERCGYMASVGSGDTSGLGGAGYGQVAQKSLPQDHSAEEVYQFRKPISEAGITVYLEVEHGFQGDEEQKVVSMVVVLGLHFEMPEVVGSPIPIPAQLEAAERSLLHAHKVEEMACSQVEGLLE